jgi:hypothetical protein
LDKIVAAKGLWPALLLGADLLSRNANAAGTNHRVRAFFRDGNSMRREWEIFCKSGE